MQARLRLALLLACCCIIGGALCGADKPSVADGYKRPRITLPYAWTKPTIDGVINDEEWQGAESTQAQQTVGKQISVRQTRFWMMWDEENLYIAMRSPLRKGERPIQRFRSRERDQECIYDDSYEVWISVGASDPLTGQPNCTTQFLTNFAGARYDLLHQPAVGNSSLGYSTNWEPVNRISPDNAWEWEMVVPRKSLGDTKKSFHDGFVFHTLIARNYKRPWEQTSFEGTSSFSVVDTHTECVMSKTLPVLHLLGVSDAKNKTIGMKLAALGQTNSSIKWKFASDSGVVKEGTANVSKGKLTSIVDDLALDKEGDGKYRITVTTTDGKNTLLDWSTTRAFGFSAKWVKEEVDGKMVGKRITYNQAETEINDSGEQLNIHTTLNPVKDYVRVFGDFINYDNRDQIKDIDVIVTDANGKTLKTLTTQIDEIAYAKGVIEFGTLAPGKYTIKLNCKKADGSVLASKETTVEKKDPAKAFKWWNTKRGNIETVIKPWTPVTYSNNTFGIWGRTMTTGAAGLPTKVVTQGHNLLAAPSQLVAELADGKTIAASGTQTQVKFNKDHRKTVNVKSSMGSIDVSSDVMVEFDGMYKLTMTLTPKKPTAVKSMKVVIPYTEAMGEYIHAVANEIRSGFFYGFTPKGKGSVWNCTLLGSRAMRLGNFIPYLWVGSPKGGMCWFADSDEGWVPNNDVPAIEIQRNKAGQVDLVLNLISSDFTIDKPRTITFAFQASPVKQMHKRWREDNWWCGDTFTNPDYSGHGPVGLIWSSTPFVLPDHTEKCKKLVESKHKGGTYAVPYFIHESLPSRHVPEVGYFNEHWRTSICRCLFYGKTLTDYMAHHYGEWAKECGIDGFYVDNMRPVVCDNIEAGRGYRLPDGRIQPSYQMFETRRYFMRVRAAFLEERPESKIVLHMTNSMVIPWVGAADVAYDGEHHVIYPESGKDFMDYWSLERMRVDYPNQWGVAVNFMHEYQGRWDQTLLHKGMRAYFATVLLQDGLPTGNNNGHARELVKIRKDFGIGDDDVTFLPYWDETGISSPTKDIKLGAWKKPNKMMLLIANFGEKQNATVKLDLAKLGLSGATLSVTDPELGHKRAGTKTVEKTQEEIAQDKVKFEEADKRRITTIKNRYEQKVKQAKKNGTEMPAPLTEKDLAPRTFKPTTSKRVPFPVWNGDNNAPVKFDAASGTLSTGVERHDYRLLIIEKK